MIARLDNLRQQPIVFGHLTGLTVAAFDELAAQVVPAVDAAHQKKLARPDRTRAIGGADNFDLSTADQLLLTVIWLRQYPTNEVLGFEPSPGWSTGCSPTQRTPNTNERGTNAPPLS